MNISTARSLRFALAAAIFVSAGSVLAQAQQNGAAGGGSQASTQSAGGSTSKDCISQPSQCDLNATITEIVAPDSPAFTVLGLSSTQVSKPTTPTEFATSVLNGFDDNGHFQSGAALDFVPFLVFASGNLSLGKYVPNDKATRSQILKSYAVRVLARTSISYATTKGTSNPDTAVRIGTGLRIVLWQQNDPRALFYVCTRNIDVPFNPAKPDDPARLKAVTDAIHNCRRASKVWNSSSLTLAGAPSWISTDGSTGNLKLNGGGYWASLAYGLGDWGQIIATGRRMTGQFIPSPSTSSGGAAGTNQFVLQDTTVAGGEFRFGRGDFNGNIQGVYVGKRTAGSPAAYPEFGIGLEKKLTTNFYLDVNYQYAVNTKLTASGIVANLEWSFSQQPKLVPK